MKHNTFFKRSLKPGIVLETLVYFLISGWVAVRQLEYGQLGHIIMVTRKENIDLARKAGVLGVATIEEALRIAYEKCGSSAPKITVMPQGANTFPILEK